MKKQWLWVLPLALAGTWYFLLGRGSENAVGEAPGVVSRRGDLKVTLDLIGELNTLDHSFVSSSFRGEIAFLAEEGPVAEGDLLVSFEIQQIEDSLENAENDLEQAQFQYDNELETIALRRVQASNALVLARERLLNSDRDYARIETQVAEGILPAANLEGAKFSRLQAEQQLEEQTLSLATSENQWELDINNRQRNVERAEGRVADWREKLDHSEIRAERAGLIVHVESWYGQWRKPEVGDNVGEGRPILDFPDTSAFLAVVKINERDLAKVSVGLPVELSVDALPGRSFQGQVHKISELATSDMGTGSITFSAQGEGKGFRAEILLSGDLIAAACGPLPGLPAEGSASPAPEEARQAGTEDGRSAPEKGAGGGEHEAATSAAGGRPEGGFAGGGRARGGFGADGGRPDGPMPGGFRPSMMPGRGGPRPDREANGCRGLRPGMTSLARIVLDELADVLILPRAAIFLHSGATVAYLDLGAGRWERVALELGAMSPREAEVLSGVLSGQRFLLVAPESDALPTSVEANSPGGPAGGQGSGGGRPPHRRGR